MMSKGKIMFIAGILALGGFSEFGGLLNIYSVDDMMKVGQEYIQIIKRQIESLV